jgi:hypothetical protein
MARTAFWATGFCWLRVTRALVYLLGRRGRAPISARLLRWQCYEHCRARLKEVSPSLFTNTAVAEMIGVFPSALQRAAYST